MHRHALISLVFVSALSLPLLFHGGLLQPQEAAGAPISCSAGLSGCHFNPAVTDGTNRNVPSGQFTGSHAKHSGSAANQYAYVCTHCHPSGSYSNNHQTGYKNITGSSLPGTSYSQGKNIALSFQNNPTFGTCSAAYCHGTAASDAWGTAGPLACNKCHAANNALPGAHGIHYASTSLPKSFSTFSGNVSTTGAYKFGCGSCHSAAKGAQHATGAANANGAAQVFYGFTSATMKGGTYAYGTLQGNDNGFKWSNGSANCNTTYCHSNGQGANGLATVAWSTTASTGTCVQCHDTKKSSGAANLSPMHDKHMNPSQNAVLGVGNGFNCADCHAKTITNTNNLTLADKTKHVNKYLDFSSPKGGGSARYNTSTKTCSQIYCHSNGNPGAVVYATVPTWNSGSTLGCNGCHGTGNSLGYPDYVNGGAGTNTANSHSKHMEGASSTTACANCHRKTPDGTVGGQFRPYTSQHMSGAPNVFFKLMDGKTGTFSGTTCSATYCHGTAASDAWGTAGPLACNKCHAANNALPGAHGIHYASTSLPKSFSTFSGNVSTTGAYKFGCGSCHSAAKGAQHANGPANATGAAQVFYGFTTATMKGGTYAYGTLQGNDNGFNWSNGSTNCNTTYCHSNGQGATGLVAVAWNTTASSGTCVQCHDTRKTSGTSGLSNLHDKHMNPSQNAVLGVGNGFNCADCHAKTITNTNNLTLADKTKHVNKYLDFSSPKGGGSARYNTGTKTCSQIYCHSNGNPGAVVYATVPAWNSGSTLGCNGCHGTGNSLGYPDYVNGGAGTTTANLHAGHLAGMADTTACADCHRKTPNAAVANQFRAFSSLHMTGSPNVYFNKTKTYIGSAAQDYGTAGAGRCSKIVCHGAGTPQWGASTTANTCQKCHGSVSTAFATVTSAQVAPGYGADGKDTGGNTAATAARVGAHQIHLTTQLVSGPVKCSECHVKVAAIRDGNHWNYSTATLTFTGRAVSGGHTSPTVSRNGSGAITCSALYCHTGKYDTGATMTPAWNSTGYLNSTLDMASCKQCHNMPPATSDHTGITNLSAFPATTCGCHNNLSSSGNSYANIFTDKFKHVNGVIEYVSSCTGCHNTAVGGSPSPSGSRRQVVASAANNGEFTITAGTKYTNMSSHVKTSTINDLTCQFCHVDNATEHKARADGVSVLLRRTDAAGTIVYNGTSASLTPFCAGCHRSAGYGGTIPTGATGTATQPYKDSGDNNSPVNIFSEWSSAGQFTGTSAEPTGTLVTNGTTVRYTHRKAVACMDCHGDDRNDSTTTPRINAHASRNGNFLRYSTTKSVVTPNGTFAESQTCFNRTTGCHGPGSTLSWAGAKVYSEFKVNNASAGTGGAHPILAAVVPKSTRISADTTGTTFVNGWKSNSIATCSDCHGGSVGGPRGPHGSTLPFILKPAAATSPTQTTSGTSFTAVTQNTRSFCLNCHAAYVYGDGNGNQGANGGTRQGHGSTNPAVAWSGTSNCSGPARSYMGNSCQNCHCGRGTTITGTLVKGTHSTNAPIGGATASSVGFANGNNWAGGPWGTGSTSGCYVYNGTNSYATCNKGANHAGSDRRFKKNIANIINPLRELFSADISRYRSDANIPLLVESVRGQQQLLDDQSRDIEEIRGMIREMNR